MNVCAWQVLAFSIRSSIACVADCCECVGELLRCMYVALVVYWMLRVPYELRMQAQCMKSGVMMCQKGGMCGDTLKKQIFYLKEVGEQVQWGRAAHHHCPQALSSSPRCAAHCAFPCEFYASHGEKGMLL